MTPAQPRHPLALLADYLEVTAEQARLITDSSVPRPPEWLPRMQALEQQQSELHDALQALDPAALRAQAEAEAGLREIAGRIAYWDQCNIKWQEGLTDDYRGGWAPIDPEHIGETYAEWAGPRPEPADHLTMWMPDEQAGGES